MKIFIGWIDVVGHIGDFQRGYRALGHKTFSLSMHSTRAGRDNRFSWRIYPDWILLTTNPVLIALRKIYSVTLKPVMLFFFWIFAIFYFDVFHFIWVPERYTPLILKTLRFLNKKIIVHFMGSDIRWVPLWLTEFEMRGLNHPEENLRMEPTLQLGITLDSQLHYTRMFEKYADLILSAPEQGQLQLRPYMHCYLPVELNNIHFKERNNSTKPVVCIGTTGFADKGSQALLDNFYRFYENSPVDFELVVIQKMPHKEVLELLMKCDIFIYSPYDCGTGKFGMEALAAGAVVLTGYDHDWLKYPLDCPVIHVQENDLIEKLLYYLNNPQERKEISKRSREFALKNADIRTITADILKFLEDPDPVYDYHPTFFREHATFNTRWDADNSIEICNKWTRYVQDCDWYKKYVAPGERKGLVFEKTGPLLETAAIPNEQPISN